MSCLKGLREKAGMTQEEVAKRADMRPNNLSRLENHEGELSMTLRTAQKLANAYEMSLGDFVQSLVADEVTVSV